MADPISPDFARLLVADISVDEQNKNLLEVIKAESEDFWPSIKRAYPDWRPPGSIKLGDKDRLSRFEALIDIGPDPMMIPDPQTQQPIPIPAPWTPENKLLELQNLLLPDYGFYVKLGIMAPPVTHPWKTLIGMGPSAKKDTPWGDFSAAFRKLFSDRAMQRGAWRTNASKPLRDAVS